ARGARAGRCGGAGPPRSLRSGAEAPRPWPERSGVSVAERRGELVDLRLHRGRGRSARSRPSRDRALRVERDRAAVQAEGEPLVVAEIAERSTLLLEVSQQLPRAAMGLTERDARADERLREVRRVQALVVTRGAHRVDVEPD